MEADFDLEVDQPTADMYSEADLLEPGPDFDAACQHLEADFLQTEQLVFELLRSLTLELAQVASDLA